MAARWCLPLILCAASSSSWLAAAFLPPPSHTRLRPDYYSPRTTECRHAASEPDLYDDLLHKLPNEDKPYLDKSLRLELLKYGELTQLTYDGFESRELNRRTGRTYWKPHEFFDKVKPWLSESTKKYRFVNRPASEGEASGQENYLYANVAVYDPKTKVRTALIPVKLAMALAGLVIRTYRWIFEASPADIEADFNHGLKFTNDNGCAWIGYIAVNEEDGDIVVAFRGTILPDEWSANFWGNVLMRPDTSSVLNTTVDPRWAEELKKVRIHDGFLSLFNSKVTYNGETEARSPRQRMQRRLEQLVNEELQGRVKTITFVGHSLGGALATIAAGYMALVRDIELKERFPDAGWEKIQLRAYTFSAPRVGGPKFQEELKNRGVQVLNSVNVWDLVPVVPGVGNALIDSWLRTFGRTAVTGQTSYELSGLTEQLGNFTSDKLSVLTGQPSGPEARVAQFSSTLIVQNEEMEGEAAPTPPAPSSKNQAEEWFREQVVKRLPAPLSRFYYRPEESFGWDLSEQLKKLNLDGVGAWLSRWNYRNSGVQLAFDSGKPGPDVKDKKRWPMKLLGPNPLTWFAFGPKHNLEGLLYLIAKQYTDPVHSPEAFRDVALMNKSDKLLKDEVMRTLDIPANWWQPQESKGMRPANVTANGQTQFILRDTKPLSKQSKRQQDDDDER